VGDEAPGIGYCVDGGAVATGLTLRTIRDALAGFFYRLSVARATNLPQKHEVERFDMYQVPHGANAMNA